MRGASPWNGMMTDMNRIVGTHDILFLTLDTLRYDVAADALKRGRLGSFAQVLPGGHWERRHSPGSFTFSAHQAFFAGFLPTPVSPGPHPRLFAAEFEGSETTTAGTYVYDAPTWVESLRDSGYLTVCIGGVGFFNQRTELARVLPGLFEISHWSPELGVTSVTSTESQFALAADVLDSAAPDQKVLMFVNVSAIHQPNCIFADAEEDSCDTQASSLEYVDGCLPALLDAFRRRGSTFCIICSDHGTAYGEDGYHGHRLAHTVVWEVPYAEFLLSPDGVESRRS